MSLRTHSSPNGNYFSEKNIDLFTEEQIDNHIADVEGVMKDLDSLYQALNAGINAGVNDSESYTKVWKNREKHNEWNTVLIHLNKRKSFFDRQYKKNHLFLLNEIYQNLTSQQKIQPKPLNKEKHSIEPLDMDEVQGNLSTFDYRETKKQMDISSTNFTMEVLSQQDKMREELQALTQRNEQLIEENKKSDTQLMEQKKQLELSSLQIKKFQEDTNLLTKTDTELKKKNKELEETISVQKLGFADDRRTISLQRFKKILEDNRSYNLPLFGQSDEVIDQFNLMATQLPHESRIKMNEITKYITTEKHRKIFNNPSENNPTSKVEKIIYELSIAFRGQNALLSFGYPT